MTGMFSGIRRFIWIAALMIGLSAALYFALADKRSESGAVTALTPASGQSTAPQPAAAADGSRFPLESGFRTAAENDGFLLRADPQTGHFIVTDKRNGKLWRSYPDPIGWNDKENTGAWKFHLRSPFMFHYVEFNVRKDLLKESNLFEQKGYVKDFRMTGQGFEVTYELPAIGFVIPVVVRLLEDGVETKVAADGLRDERTYTEAELQKKKDPKARLVSLRLYPFFGAKTSDDETGFLFIPDGMGAIVKFKKDRSGSSSFYKENVYGDDWAYRKDFDFSIRKPVKMPVFGMNGGKQAFLAVLHQGEEYASILAAPSRTFSQYNWASAEHRFRFLFFQPTNTKKTEGFFTFSGDMVRTDRITRYYLLEKPDADYVDLGAAYRDYLIREKGVQPIAASDRPLPLQLHLLGTDTAKGFLWNSPLPLTTTDQATEIVRNLSSLGVESMDIVYSGWQRGGFSSFGGYFPVGRKTGGNEGMRSFIDFAHSKGYSVTLDARAYTFNSNGKDGFRRSRDALRDLGSDIIDFSARDGIKRTIVSPVFVKKTFEDDLPDLKSLGADGLLFGNGIGTMLNTDYNENYPVTREQSKQIQLDIFAETKKEFGSVQVLGGNFYTLPYVSHIHEMPDDYSYDLFVDEKVPFAEIAVHGLATYSLKYANINESSIDNFLRSIEYGAEPAFVATYEPSRKLLKSMSLQYFYSTYYKDWLVEMVSQYERYNQAVEDVRHRFITGHRKLAEGVYETMYSNGKRIVVNYNGQPYKKDGVSVKPQDFAIVQGGS